MSTIQSLIAEEELSELKLGALHSVLNDKVFPGSNEILRFADLPFVLTQPDVYLVDENIKESIHIEKMNKLVQLVSEESLQESTPRNGKTIYFKFLPHLRGGNTLVLCLDAKVFSAFEGRTSTLSSLCLKLQKVGGKWTIMEAPSFLSA